MRDIEQKLWKYLEDHKIDFTEIQTNYVDDDCFDYFIRECDYLEHKEILDELTSGSIENFLICGIVFYTFPDSLGLY